MAPPSALPYERAQRVPLPVTIGFACAMALMMAGVAAMLVSREGGRSLVFLIPMLPAMGVLAYVMIAFRELRVEVREGEVRLAFGKIGPRRRIDLATVRSVRPTRSRALYGWGIRGVPNGWMWNIWGLDAVELELSSGKRCLIGTDRPGELAAAIETARRETVA